MPNELQEKRTLLKAFNELTTRRTQGHLCMAVTLWQVHGLQCGLEFIAKMKEYEQTDRDAPFQFRANEARASIIQALQWRIGQRPKGLPGLVEAARQERTDAERVKAFWQAPGMEDSHD